MASDMTIDEAIKHAEEVAHRKCNECGRQHQQLANWLKELVELRECMKEAIDVACDGCHLAVWKSRKFVKCKRHKNWKCPFGTERWRKALEVSDD